ncbi:hypothetical protein/acyl-CoA dehydrogenase [Albimonas donghaensis]|uniref:Acyl-CoA dehydrogenase n=1 Tax=Albimonas donghaensis TaxID=356660 RepID=A0A1H2QFX2_9RHOB|nr:acyl-CoA dehydrogenase family protein [Albimonas donghaensis]SDW06107.1 hypothetical protein/acyl-CoA dehydrogenase [Albimonas donghaensis]
MIDFQPDDEQLAILETVDRFMARRLPPEEQRRRDEGHAPPYDLLPEMGALGLLGLPFPAAFGGLEADWRTVALVQERMGLRGRMAASIFNRVIGFGGMSLMTYGSPAQREAFLPGLIAGELLFALALTEADAGSDAAGVKLKAARTASGWRLNGRKTWISDAQGASHLVTIARTDPEASRHAGISALLVPTDAPGLSMTPIPKLGNNCMPSFEVFYDNVDVGEDALMGAEGQGFAAMSQTLKYGRGGLAASCVGAAQRAVDLALAHAKERVQFGRPIGAFQAVQHRLADMQMRVDQARLACWHLAWLIATGRDSTREASQAKVIASEALQYATHHGMQILASAGYAAESEMGRLWRDARLFSFGEGANEIQRSLIARSMGL